MGWNAGRKLRQAVANLTRILAVELTCAGRALELRQPLQPAAATGAVVDAIRTQVPGAGPDRWLAPELEAVERLIVDGTVTSAVARAIGPLEQAGDMPRKDTT